jgi:hypothetical protein
MLDTAPTNPPAPTDDGPGAIIEEVTPQPDEMVQDTIDQDAISLPDPNGAQPSAQQEPATPGTTQPVGSAELNPDLYIPQAPIATSELSAKITANPQLRAVIDADPTLKNSLFANARMAAETAKFKAVFPNPEQAQVALAQAKEYAEVADLITSIHSAEEASKFYDKVRELSVIRDDDGNVMLHPQSGLPMSDGTLGRLIEYTGDLFLKHWENVAKQSNDPELAAAADILRARAFSSGTAPTHDGLTDEQKAAAEKLARDQAAFTEQQKKHQEQQRKEFDQKVVDGIDANSLKLVNLFLDSTDIQQKDRERIAAEILKETYDLVAQNPLFHGEQDNLMRRLMGPKTLQARVELGTRYFHNTYLDVARAKIAAEGVKYIAKQEKQQQAQAARVDASRSEAPGSLRTTPPVQQNAAQQFEAVNADLRKSLNREPSTAEIFAEVQRRKTAS